MARAMYGAGEETARMLESGSHSRSYNVHNALDDEGQGEHSIVKVKFSRA